MESNLDAQKLLSEIKKQDEWAKAIIFDDQANIITHLNCNTSTQELSAYLKAFDSRDNTIGAGSFISNPGFTLLGEHYDVHR